MSRHQAPSDEVNALRLAVMELWDPIGVADIPEAVDEYDSYLPSIRRELHEGSSDSLSRYLHDVSTVQIGLSRTAIEDQWAAEALVSWGHERHTA